MIFEDPMGLKLPNICLTGEEIPKRTSRRKLVPNGDGTQANCETGAYATACSTTVDSYLLMILFSLLAIGTYFVDKLFTVFIIFNFIILFNDISLLFLFQDSYWNENVPTITPSSSSDVMCPNPCHAFTDILFTKNFLIFTY